MKSVKDPEALNALAKKTGSKVTGGKVFTTPKPDPALAIMGKHIIEAGKANIKMLNELKKMVSAIEVAPMPKQKFDPAINDINENIIKANKANLKALEELKKQIKDIPVVELPEPDPAITEVSKNIIEAEKSNVMMLNDLRRQVSEIQLMTPEPITQWDIDFIRDDKGYLQKCVMNGTPDPKRLN